MSGGVSADIIAIDSSAFFAIAGEESEAQAFHQRIGMADQRLMSAGNYVECGFLAISRLNGLATLDYWVHGLRIEIVPVDLAMAQAAAEAFGRFGKGRHRAKLNYGDCFAYALAKSRDAPLLYKGGDFGLTDLTPALP